MDRKSYLIVVLFILLPPWGIRATGLMADVIYIQGEKWDLMAKPFHEDSAVFARLMNFIPRNHCVSTANWEGYTAFWEIKHDSLYLQKMEVCLYDKEKEETSTLTLNIEALQAAFPDYYTPEGICARWLNGEIRAGKGEWVRYVHSGFARNMATEKVMTVENGEIIRTCLFHNYRQAGLNLKNAQAELAKRFPWQQFPEVKGKRLIFHLGDWEITNEGRLADVKIFSVDIRPGGEKIETADHPLIKALREVMKSIYPWEILYINGKYRAEFMGFMMPIWENFPSQELNAG